jgi:hypothetical protein
MPEQEWIENIKTELRKVLGDDLDIKIDEYINLFTVNFILNNLNELDRQALYDMQGQENGGIEALNFVHTKIPDFENKLAIAFKDNIKVWVENSVKAEEVE